MRKKARFWASATCRFLVRTLAYDYFKDQYQQTGVLNAKVITVDNRRVVVPSTLGAYYDTRDTGVPLFNRIDAGLHAGLGIFMSQGLYLGARIQKGIFCKKRLCSFFFKFILSKVNIKYLFSQNCRFKPRATALPTMPQRPLKNTKLTTVTYLQIVKFKMSALISFYIKIRNNETIF